MEFLRSHKLIAATIAIQIIVLPIILLVVRQPQETQTNAQQSSVLFFNPTSSENSPITKNVGEGLSVDLMLNPGTNLVSLVKLEIIYDATKIKLLTPNNIQVNSQSFPVTVEGPILTESGTTGKVQIAVSVGSVQAQVIQTQTKVLTLNFTTAAEVNQTSISFGANNQLYSIAPGDTADENVLDILNSTPATVRINALPTNTPIPTPVACVPAYTESGGSVVVEAEKYDLRSSNGNSHSWSLVNGGPYPEQPGDILFMRTNPIDGATIGAGSYQNSPEIAYNIDFTTTGTYYLYIRGSGNTASSHITHFGLDNNYIDTLNNYYVGQDGNNTDWLWTSKNNDGSRPTVNISTPGVHTLHFWMRDTGAKIDRIRLVQNSSWIPSVTLADKGPNESARTTCPDISITPVITPIIETVTPTPTPTLTPTPTPIPTLTPTPSKTPTPSPTYIPTSTPTPTPIPATTVINFTGLKLHGLGKGGDSPNPTSEGTLNPTRPNRALTVEIYNTSGVLVNSSTGGINYNGIQLGTFDGQITLPSSINSGNYIVKIKTPFYLRRQLAGFMTITKGQVNNAPSATLIAGDVNNDNALSVEDYDLIMDCYSDLLPATNCDANKKLSADISDDGQVNADDYNLFLRELSVQSGD